MEKKSWRYLLLTGLLLVASWTGALAAPALEAAQVYTDGQTMTVLLRGGTAEGLQCSVSNQPAEIGAAGPLAEGGLVRTTLLIDVSASIPSSMRERVIQTIGQLVEHKPAGEEYRIVAFGNEVTVLQSFTADRYDLANAVEDIAFTDQQSRIYDAIYHTIPPLTGQEGVPTLSRTIVITDCVDDTALGVTMEELLLALQSERYPVDVIAVSQEETTENKELAAITRISGGTYCALTASTDQSALEQSLSTEGYFYLTAQVPEHLLDGTTRQVDITGAGGTLSFDVKFPALYVPAQPEEPSQDPVPDQSKPEPEEDPEDEPEEDDEDEPVWDEPEEGIPALYLYIGGGAAVLLAVVIVLVVVLRKRKKPVPAPPPAVPERPAPVSTEYFDDSEAACTVKLSDVQDPSRSWLLPVRGEVLIGREPYCQVQLADATVSRLQCRLLVQDGALVLKNEAATNTTRLNGAKVQDACVLQPGDILKMGRTALQVDHIQTLDQSAPEGPNGRSGMTEAIF